MEDVRALYRERNRDAVAYINPGCNAREVKALQLQGIWWSPNFSATPMR